MAQKDKIRVPREVREDKPEQERKHRVLGTTWQEKAARLDAIFNFVAAQKSHFVTLDQPLHSAQFDPELAAASEFPAYPKPLRRRFYWATKTLDGYRDGDIARAEVRTERKTGKGYWEQTLKLGGTDVAVGAGKTLRRGEYKRALDGFGVNLDVYPKPIRRQAYAITGGAEMKPLIELEGQSKPVLYHPDGRTDILFEIKFDKGKGFTFDGVTADVVEIEIEVKEAEGVPEGEVEALLDRSEQLLYGRFGKSLEPIYEAKVAELFRHLAAWRARDSKGFETAFKVLPGDRWETLKP